MKRPIKEGDKKTKNKYSFLTVFPDLPKANTTLSIKEHMINLSNKPNLKDNPSSSATKIFVQIKDIYEMKPAKVYSKAVVSNTPSKNKEKDVSSYKKI